MIKKKYKFHCGVFLAIAHTTMLHAMNSRNYSIFTSEFSQFRKKQTATPQLQQHSNLSFDQFSLGSNKQFHSNSLQYKNIEAQITDLRNQHAVLFLEMQKGIFAHNALADHIELTKRYGYTDLVDNSNHMITDLTATKNQLSVFEDGQHIFGNPIPEVEKYVKTLPAKSQAIVYNELIKADALYIKCNVLKGCLDHNEKMIKQFQIQIKQETQKYGTAISAKPITEYQRTELPQLQQTTVKLQAAISQLQQELAQQKQQQGEIQKKLSAFDGKRTTKIGAHFKAVCDSGNNKESLTYDKRLIDERIGQLERQIGQYKDAIVKVDAKIEYVKEAITKYQQTYTDQAKELRNLIDKQPQLVPQNNPFIQVLDACIKNKAAFDCTVNDTLTQQARAFLQNFDVAPALYEPTIGNPVQKYLSDNIATIINKEAASYSQDASPLDKAHTEATIQTCAYATDMIFTAASPNAIVATTLAHEVASSKNDPLFKAVKSIAKGVQEGIKTVIDNDVQLVTKPIEIIVETDIAVCKLGWFLMTSSTCEKIGALINSSIKAGESLENLPFEQQVEQVTQFITSAICPSPLMLVGGTAIHTAQSLRSAQRAISSIEKALQLEAQAAKTAKGIMPVIKAGLATEAEAKEISALIQSGAVSRAEEIAAHAQRQKMPLLTHFKEKILAQKEEFVLAECGGGIITDSELKFAREMEEGAKISGGSGIKSFSAGEKTNIQYKIVKDTKEKCRQVAPIDDVKANIEWAPKKYEAIRNCADDIQVISKNTGMAESRIKTVKDHLFYNEHILDKRVDKFAPDPEIASAWDRLYQGDFIKNDLQLLNHEYFEARIEGLYRTTYREAHNATQNLRGQPWSVPIFE